MELQGQALTDTVLLRKRRTRMQRLGRTDCTIGSLESNVGVAGPTLAELEHTSKILEQQVSNADVELHGL